MDWRDPEIAAVRAYLAESAGERPAGPPNVDELRRGMDLRGGRNPLPEGCRVLPAAIDGVAAEWIEPAGAIRRGVILYFHGGGYVSGSCQSHRHLVTRLCAAAGCRGLSVAYRLAPEFPFPAGLEDAVTVFIWLLNNGLAASEIVIVGDSAGGGLALAAALRLKALKVAAAAALYLISPWLDLSLTGRSHDLKSATDPILTTRALAFLGDLYRGTLAVDDPRVSPLTDRLEDLPPMLIHVGSEEVLLSDSVALAERAGSAGVAVRLEIWAEMIHVWPMFHARLAEAGRAIEVAGAWIAGQLRH